MLEPYLNHKNAIPPACASSAEVRVLSCCSSARMDRIRSMRWQHRDLPESFKENLNPAEQQVSRAEYNVVFFSKSCLQQSLIWGF